MRGNADHPPDKFELHSEVPPLHLSEETRMTKENHEAGNNAVLETRPWWRHSHVAYAIGFRGMLVASVISPGLLIFWIVRELLHTASPDFSVVLRVVEQSFVGCSVAGLLAGFIFGVPLGIVSVLSTRESLLELEQQLEHATDTRDDHPERKKSEQAADGNADGRV